MPFCNFSQELYRGVVQQFFTMPKATQKSQRDGRGRGRGRRLGTAVRRSPRKTQVQEEEEEERAQQPAAEDSDLESLPPEPTEEAMEEEREEEREAEDEITDDLGRHFHLEVEEKIASFFEDRPYFYDLSHPQYKNKQKKNAELQAFAPKLGMDREYTFIFLLFLPYIFNRFSIGFFQ